MKINNVLVVYYVHNYNTLKLVCRVLSKLEVSFTCIRRVTLRKNLIKGKDLVIVIGGDGTFLRVAHKVDYTPVFAVSSDVRYNEAFFSRATPDDFERKIKRLLKGKFKITRLPRLEAKINGKKLPLTAINEIFLGSRHPYHTSRYEITVNGKTEFQKSSGVLITTLSGSTGWAKSAARKKFSISKNGFGYVVREPYIGRLTKSKLLQGTFSAKEKIKVKSLIHKGIVIVDSSPKEFKFVDGYKLEVSISNKPLNYVEF